MQCAPRFGRARVRQRVVENKQRAVRNATSATQPTRQCRASESAGCARNLTAVWRFNLCHLLKAGLETLSSFDSFFANGFWYKLCAKTPNIYAIITVPMAVKNGA